MFKRILENKIQKKFFQGKAIIITGARQTGKTTLVKNILAAHREPVRMFNCDNPTDRDSLTNKDFEFLQQLIGNATVIFIDEGQKVPTIGQTVKLLVDHYGKKRQVIVTGSSSRNLLTQTEEALTGRKYVFPLFPLSLEEIYQTSDALRFRKELDRLLIFGQYPEIIGLSSFEAKRELLEELTKSSLSKEILDVQGLRHTSDVRNILKALALQLGSEVSLNELSRLVGLDKKTVDRYIDLLEQAFIVFRLSPYTHNKRREISRMKKIYFYDIGIRNALINNFNFLDSRNDIGALFENFLIAERMKYRTYHDIYANQYFWRTYDGSEIDLIEEREGRLHGYEMKWGDRKVKKTSPTAWQEYQKSSYAIISPNTLKGFVW